ncbi:MAG: N5-glutamine methyltransferase family protein [Acidimicrobiales bacterium]
MNPGTEPWDGIERRRVRRALATALGSDHEARWLLEDVAGAGSPDAALRGEAAARVRELAGRRESGEPLQYVLGHWPFRQLDLLVDARALIPRPETEWLVDVALAELDRTLADGGNGKVVDLGTGTGAIALAIATERHGHGVDTVATDLDEAVLELAEENRARAGGPTVEFRQGSWWDALDADDRGRVALVVANPPYVAAVEWELLDPVVRDHEPYGALVAGPGRDGVPGLADVESILAGAGEWLARPGAAVIEIAPTQERAARLAARRAGATDAEVLADLAGRPRALVARWR